MRYFPYGCLSPHLYLKQLFIISYILMSVLVQILIITLIKETYSEQSNYPGCVKQLLSSSSDDINSDENFIKLSQFLIKTDTDTQMTDYAQAKVKSGQILERSDQPFSSNQQYTQNQVGFYVLFASIGFLCLFLIFIRIKASSYPKLRTMLPKNLQPAMIPSTALASFISLSFFIVFMGFMFKYPNFVQSSQCSYRYMKDLILNGNNQSGWAGFIGYKNLVSQSINYLNTIQNMPNSFNYELNSLKNRVNDRQKYPNEFLWSFGDQNISYTDSVNGTTYRVKARDLLPQLLSVNSSQRTILNKLNQSIVNLYIQICYQSTQIYNQTKELQAVIQDTKMNASDIEASLNKKLIALTMQQEQIQKSTMFSSTFQQSQSQSQLQQSGMELDPDQMLLLLSRLFIAVGVQTCLTYICLILISIKVNTSLIIKFTNFLWIVFLIQLCIGVVIIYYYFIICEQLGYKCTVFQNILTNQTYYSQFANSSITVTNITNLMILLKPCIFQNAVEQPTFWNIAKIQQDLVGLSSISSSMIRYLSYYDPTHSQYLNPFNYDNVIDQAVSFINTMKNNEGRLQWQVLQQLTEGLNNYTYFNLEGTKCYRHLWVLNHKQCPSGYNILTGDSHDLQLTASQYDDYASNITTPVCLLVSSRNYSQMLSNYPLTDARCQSSNNEIRNKILSLSQAQQTKNTFLSSLQINLQQQRQNLNQFLRILRSNQIIKTEQYKYIASNGANEATLGQTQNFKYMMSQHNNCSCVKEGVLLSYNNVCIHMRAHVLKIYLILLIIVVCLAALIFLGAVYGLNQELNQIQALLLIDQDSSHRFENYNVIKQISVDSDQKSQNKEKTAKIKRKFIQYFFGDKND